MGAVVAIDGPAASGKGTVARHLASRLSYAWLDTGVLYRATAARILDEDTDIKNTLACAQAASNLTPRDMARPDLRTPVIDRIATRVAAYPAVRAALLDYQRTFAATPPDGQAGAVLDGRDIGTVVCPDAPVKLFITASLEARAQRRFLQRSAMDSSTSYDLALLDIERRDELDKTRSAAPLIKAETAHLIDTTDLGIETAVEVALRITKKCLGLDLNFSSD